MTQKADIQEPKLLSPWLHHHDSLTDRLIAAKGSCDLDLLFQKWTNTTWWDHYFLQISDPLVFERAIIMKSKGLEYWYARTIIPDTCFNLNPNFFKRLENESIRNLIFNGSDVHRVAMIHYPIDPQCIEYYWIRKYLKSSQQTLWARLAKYTLHHLESFYLIEILFPELENVSYELECIL